MKKNTRVAAGVATGMVTVGIDLGDQYSHICVLGDDGEVQEEGRVRTTRDAFERRFSGMAPCRAAIEVGTHSRWVDEVLSGLGYEVIVANPRKLRAIYQNESKCDRTDATMLARLARTDPALLSPIQHRGAVPQEALGLVRARATAVKARTGLVNHVRGVVKSHGVRISPCTVGVLPARAREELSPDLIEQLEPLLKNIEQLTETIEKYEQQIEEKADKLAPGARPLTKIYGVGLLTAVCFVSTLGDASRFGNSRSVGAYLGLRPKRDQSGRVDKALGISKCGDQYMRVLLVQAAHCILSKRGPDCDLRRWGLKLAGTGKSSKKRAIIAVARKLAVLMHKLWSTEQEYDPDYQIRQTQRGAIEPKAA